MKPYLFVSVHKHSSFIITTLVKSITPEGDMMIQEYIRFFSRCWPLLLFGILTVFWGNFGQSFFISWYGASFQQSLGLSATEYGSAYSMATLASGLLLMWIGSAVDKFSLTKLILFCATGLIIACLMIFQVDSLAGLVIGLFLLRFFGQGLLPHTSITTMLKKFSINRGKAVSIASTGVPLGEIVLPSFAVFLIAMFGWKQSWLVICSSIVLIYLPLALWSANKGKNEKYNEKTTDYPKSSTITKIEDGSRRTLLTDYRFWLALPAILAAPFIVTGIFIHQGFILPEMNWTPQLFASCFIVYGISHWYASMFSGSLVDRYSGIQLLKFFPIPMLTALSLPTIFSGTWVAYALMFFLGMSIGASSPIINALWAEAYGTKYLGGIRALITSLAVISTSASPILFGFLIDGGISAKTLFLWLFFYILASIILVQFSYCRTRLAN